MPTHKPRGYSVNDFLSWDERGELLLQPKFQRRDVWPPKAKSHLIDTILRGLPVPIIFIRQDVDPTRRKTIREVVDGQQRLRSVIAFSKDAFRLLKSHNEVYGGMTFSEFDEDTKKAFLNYEFSVVILDGATDRDVLDVFARLNTYAQTLTKQELLNGKFFGQFKQVVYSLGLEHLEFWRTNRILIDSQIIRMAEAELAGELVVTMLEGIQHRRKKIEESYDKWDDEFPDGGRIRKQFRATIDAIGSCFDGDLRSTAYSSRVLFHSLFCAFFHMMFGIPGTPELGPSNKLSRLSGGQLANIRDSLTELQTKYKSTSPPQQLRKFIEACQKATGDRDQRVTRTKTIVEYMRRGLKA